MEQTKIAPFQTMHFSVSAVSSVAMENSGLEESMEDQEIRRSSNPDIQNGYPGDNTVEQDLQKLICRIIKQDQSAFTVLFKAMSAPVNSLALRITGSIQLAEEVTEDTFFQVWRQAPRFDPLRGTVKAWILTIARSRALDARRNTPLFDDLTESVAEESGKKLDDLPDLLSAIEQNQLLHSALTALEPIPRQLIALSFFRGLSHEEIATHAELPLGTVKSHIRRAVIHLREALENH